MEQFESLPIENGNAPSLLGDVCGSLPCDYRRKECTNNGKTVNGKWVCSNHLKDLTNRPIRTIRTISEEAIEFAEWLRTFPALEKKNVFWILERQISSKKLYNSYLIDRARWRKER